MVPAEQVAQSSSPPLLGVNSTGLPIVLSDDRFTVVAVVLLEQFDP